MYVINHLHDYIHQQEIHSGTWVNALDGKDQ